MSHKDALLEQAAISAAGLQQSHILGIFLLLILIITVFALLGLKKITWALLLMLNIVLFAYLMKLTVDGSVKETVIGKIVPDVDSDEEEDDEEDDEGGYQNPSLPDVKQTELPEIA
jgi:cobalamin biosynthesis protein CobD/CbiB